MVKSEDYGMRVTFKTLACLFVVASVLLLSCSLVVQAKPSLSLSFYKNNGYGMGSDIGGVWTVNTDVSADVMHVEFYLDGQLQQNDTSKPYSWQFDTNNYASGPHTIKVVALDSLGQTETASADRNFQEYSGPGVLTIIGVVVTVIVIIAAFAAYKLRK